jgi:hypothetical protein
VSEREVDLVSEVAHVLSPAYGSAASRIIVQRGASVPRGGKSDGGMWASRDVTGNVSASTIAPATDSPGQAAPPGVDVTGRAIPCHMADPVR